MAFPDNEDMKKNRWKAMKSLNQQKPSQEDVEKHKEHVDKLNSNQRRGVEALGKISLAKGMVKHG